MTDINFSKMRNFPLNRDGETLAVSVSEGDLVGLTENSGETEIVQADADSASPQPAMGVALEEVWDPTDVSVSGFQDADIQQSQLRREVRTEDYTLVGDEGTYVFTGVYMEDTDGTLDLTPNEPVYLAVGGGVTQSKPDGTAGNIIQRIGVAVNTTTFLLDVDFDYTTA
jgi:hypothetical protein